MGHANDQAPAPADEALDRRDRDRLDVIELAMAILTRNVELTRNRSDIDTDLDRSEYLLLRTLVHTGPADIGTLAGILGLDPSTAGRQVAVMVRKGLVDRTAAPGDRRRAVVTATGTGRRLLDATSRRRRGLFASLLADWSDDDLDMLGALVTRFNQAVARAYLTPPAPPPPPQPLAALDLDTLGAGP
ncbi:MAG TPA: MarR family transcriptional regulator [Trebonia sp.]